MDLQTYQRSASLGHRQWLAVSFSGLWSTFLDHQMSVKGKTCVLFIAMVSFFYVLYNANKHHPEEPELVTVMVPKSCFTLLTICMQHENVTQLSLVCCVYIMWWLLVVFRYYELLMINPAEEISPSMVISETLSKFFLQPLQHIGKEMALLITNFYGEFLDSLF